MGGLSMKQFNVEEYRKNPSRKVVTRDGRNVTIHCTNCVGFRPVIAEIEGEDYSLDFNKNGIHCRGISNDDLFFASEKHEGWINLYKNEDGISWISPNYFASKKEAEREGKTYTCNVTTIKIEWEE